MRGDLARIADGLAAHPGGAVAERNLDAFAEALRRLARTPHKGTIRSEIGPGLRAIPATGRGVTSSPWTTKPGSCW
ncbi:hypothetical protein BH23PSE1_BH23PSE1_14000 [soil metagenome]